MKTLSQAGKISLNFSMVPRSISDRLRQLAGKTAGELLRLLCELTIGFRKTKVERSYRQLAELLGKSVATIARAVKLLLTSGDVVVESRLGRSYRWSVLLEPSDIRSDPAGICLVRGSDSEQTPTVDSKVAEKPGPVEDAPAVTPEAPVGAPATDEPTEAASEPTAGTKALFKRLINVGMRRRVARELLVAHEHDVIVAALDRVKNRSDINNKAGYVLREVKEGGYEVEMPTGNTTEMVVETESSRYSSAERTRLEQEELEAERLAKQQRFDQALRGLEVRCGQLSDGVRAHLRDCCQRYICQLAPSSKGSILEGPASKAFKKIAFKEVMERFFGLLDQGLAEEEALGQVSLAIS